MKRAICALLASITVAGLLTGCGDAHDIWRDEFDARLDGASAAVEEAQTEVRRDPPEIEYYTTLRSIGESLLFKSNLIKELDPPASCEAVQVKGGAAVYGDAELLASLFKNETPYLKHRLPAILAEEVAELKKLEYEAETCA